MSKISREKYDTLKSKAQKWYERATELEERYNRLFEENKTLIEENDELNQKMTALKEEVRNTSTVDTSQLGELEEDNRELRKGLRTIKKKLAGVDEKSKRDQFEIEKKLVLKQAEVDRTQATVEDLKERYKELKEENRELRRERRGVQQ